MSRTLSYEEHMEIIEYLKRRYFDKNNVLQLDLFVPPLHGDKEYYQAKQSLELMNLSKRQSELKERKEIEYRIRIYELSNFKNQ